MKFALRWCTYYRARHILQSLSRQASHQASYTYLQKKGPDVITCHNGLRNIIYKSCKQALLNSKLQEDNGLGHDLMKMHPADILIDN